MAIKPNTSWVQRVDDVAWVIEVETRVAATGILPPWMFVPILLNIPLKQR
jgi:hypothetical protein